MTGKLHKIFRKESGCLWYGYIPAGAAGLPGCCLRLDKSPRLFKDREKIRAGAVDGMFIKRYNLPGMVNQLRSWLKMPRPFIALRGEKYLACAGIDTPEVLAAVVSLDFLRRREYLATALVEAPELFLNRMLLAGKSCEVWQILLEKFLPALKKLHDSGAIHGDLSMRNLYWKGERPGVIDLDGMRFFAGKVPDELRIKECARVISSFYMSMPYAPGEISSDLQIPAEKISAAAAAYGEIDPERIAFAVQKFIRRGRKYL